MKLGWVVFFELALFNIFIAALVIAAEHLGYVLTALVGVSDPGGGRCPHVLRHQVGGRQRLRSKSPNPPSGSWPSSK